MNKRKTFFSLASSVFALSLLVSCGGNVVNIEVVPNYKIVSNHTTDYQIIYNGSTSTNLAFAISEFNTFVEASSGAKLNIVNEQTNTIDKSLPFISFGDTAIAKEYNVSLPSDKEYLNSGYYLKNVNENFFILSDANCNQEGIIYGAYALLEKMIDFKVYADDEIEYTKSGDLYLKGIDESYIPSFDARELGFCELISDKSYSTRLKLINRDTDARWALHGHTSISTYHELLNVDTYYEDHPLWYTGSGSQLCYTGHGTEYKSSVEQMAYNMYHNYILKNDIATYFMIGQSDNRDFCSCEACQAKDKEYELDGRVSGLIILYINDVITRIEEMMKEANDTKNLNRDIRYVFFGYENTIKSFTSNKVVPHKKLYLEFTPIELNFARDMHTGTANSEFYTHLTRWNEVFEGRMLVYSYDVNFMYYLLNFNNFNTFKSYLEDYRENNVKYFYAQGPVGCNVAGFTNLRFYVESQLLWNLDQNYDDLAYDFIDHYYKDAAQYMKEYYQITRDRYVYYTTAVDDSINGIYGSIASTNLWDKPTVDALYACLNNSLKAIEKYKETDYEYFTKLSYRIKHELVTVYFLIFTNFSGFYNSESYNTMLEDFHDICDHFNIVKSYEGGSGLPF